MILGFIANCTNNPCYLFLCFELQRLYKNVRENIIRIEIRMIQCNLDSTYLEDEKYQ